MKDWQSSEMVLRAQTPARISGCRDAPSRLPEPPREEGPIEDAGDERGRPCHCHPHHEQDSTRHIPSPGQLGNPTPRLKIPHPQSPDAEERRITTQPRGLEASRTPPSPRRPMRRRSHRLRGPRAAAPSDLTATGPLCRTWQP